MTQLRARRTRLRILRAIAERNGVAGFSHIKDSTGLSTGSIYYHIEHMSSYVTKDSKHYTITEEGLHFLQEADPKYDGIAPGKKEEQAQREESGRSEETVRNARYTEERHYVFVVMIVAAIALMVVRSLGGWQILPIFAGINPGAVMLLATIAAFLASFVILGRQSYPIIS